MALAMTAALAPVAAAVVSAPAAQAHSVLVSTTPEQDSTVADSPESVDITFNEEISAEFASLTVMSDGENVAEGEPEVDGDSISVKVPDLEAGTYIVGYRVVSADGHPVQGSWEFTVEAGGAQGSGAAAATGSEESAEGTAPAEGTAGAGSASDNASEPGTDAADASDESENEGSNLFVTSIALLAVLAIVLIGGAAVLLQRHKKNMAQFHENEQ